MIVTSKSHETSCNKQEIQVDLIYPDIHIHMYIYIERWPKADKLAKLGVCTLIKREVSKRADNVAKLSVCTLIQRRVHISLSI